jgi:hypothetical protein
MRTRLNLWLPSLFAAAVILTSPHHVEACSPVRGEADITFSAGAVRPTPEAFRPADALFKRFKLLETTQDYAIVLTARPSPGDARSKVLGKSLSFERMAVVQALIVKAGIPEEKLFIFRVEDGSDIPLGRVELEFIGFFGCARGSSLSFPPWPAE